MKSLKHVWLLVVLLALAACGQDVAPETLKAVDTAAPTITSDKEDYAPGELVTLTGSNWQAGESVQIVVDDDGLDVENPFKRTVTVVADESGNITDQFNLPNWFVADYKVAATGEVSGTATHTFTDALPGEANVTPGSIATGSTSVKFTVTVTNKSSDVLGSAKVLLPNGYTYVSLGSASNNNWSATYKATDRKIELKAKANNVRVGLNGSISVEVTATAPTATGSTTWTTEGWKQIDFSGPEAGTFIFNPQPSVTVTAAITCTAASVATQPGVQSITYGANATFTATSSGSPVPTVQWQTRANADASWSNVSGATSTTLALAKPSVSQSGSQYQAVFTNDCGGTKTATSNAATLTVAAKSVTGSFTTTNKEYNGNTSANVTGRSLDGAINGDNVSLDGGTASFGTKDVGTGKTVTLTGASLAGDDKSNYSLSSVSTATASITPKSLTVTGLSASNKEYNGNTSATITGDATLSGKVDSDDVSLSGTVSGAFADKNVGDDKVVTVSSVSLSGADAGNYTLTQPSGLKANITAKNVTGSFTAADKQYDGSTLASISGRSLSGVIGTERVSLTGGTASFDSKNVGSHSITGSGFSLDGDDKGNYSLGAVTASAKASITAKEVTGSFTTSNKEYDGSASATVAGRSLSGAINGEDVSLDGGTASFGDKNVGTGKTVTLTGASLAGADKGNYSLSSVSTATANITAKEVTGSFTASNKEYDGSASATVTGRSLSGAINGEDVSLSGDTASFGDKNVGESKPVTGSDLVLSGTDARNYVLGTISNTTADITPRALTVSATGVDRVYDGTTNATVNLSTNKLDGDTVTAAYTSASFSDKNVGTNKSVSVSGISIGGTDAGNYSFAITTASTTAEIKKATVTGSFTAASKLYDGNTTATILTYSLSGEIGSDAVTLTGTATFDSATVGSNKTVTGTNFSLSGNDAGNYSLSSVSTTTASISAWTLRGFYSPVDMSSTSTIVWNTVKNGSTVPLKFNVFAGTTERTSTADIQSFSAVKVTCSASGIEDAIEEFATTGGTNLRYSDGKFIQNWATPKAINTCYPVTVTTKDASTISAYFKLK